MKIEQQENCKLVKWTIFLNAIYKEYLYMAKSISNYLHIGIISDTNTVYTYKYVQNLFIKMCTWSLLNFIFCTILEHYCIYGNVIMSRNI